MTRERPVPRSTRARRTARLVRHLAGVYASAVWRAPRLEPAERRELAVRFAREMLDDVLQVRLHVRGTPRERTPALIVANHVSWLDMYVLNAVAGARFVAKSEVRGWPFFGTIAARFDTFFIVRGNRDAGRMRTAVARALRAGERVAVFPEGTTTDGTTVGRFFPALFQAAIDARAPVQPAALRYRDAHGLPSAAPAFVGDTTVLASVRQVLREPVLSAEAILGPSLDPAGRTRRELAEHTRDWIAATLGTGERASAERRAA